MADYQTLLAEYGENDKHLRKVMAEYLAGVAEWVNMEIIESSECEAGRL